MMRRKRVKSKVWRHGSIKSVTVFVMRIRSMVFSFYVGIMIACSCNCLNIAVFQGVYIFLNCITCVYV